LHRDEEGIGHGQGGAETASVASAHVYDHVGVLWSELPDLGSNGGPVQRDSGVARLTELFRAKLGKADRGALLIPVHEQHVSASERTGDG